MTDNEVIAIVAAAAVVISAFCVLAGAIYSNSASKETFNIKIDSLNKRLDKIDATLALIQSDMKEWFIQITKIKAHIKMD